MQHDQCNSLHKNQKKLSGYRRQIAYNLIIKCCKSNDLHLKALALERFKDDLAQTVGHTRVHFLLTERNIFLWKEKECPQSLYLLQVVVQTTFIHILPDVFLMFWSCNKNIGNEISVWRLYTANAIISYTLIINDSLIILSWFIWTWLRWGLAGWCLW